MLSPGESKILDLRLLRVRISVPTAEAFISATPSEILSSIFIIPQTHEALRQK
ncbi:MAG: hypothetical protein RJB13_264 [Pseudomonadota bacterium]